MENIKYKDIERSINDANKILVDFEVMFDLDLACVYYIVNNVKNVNIIDPNIGKANTLSGIRNLLLFRQDMNPLSVCIKEEYYGSINGIYKELLDKHEDELLENCQVNDLYNFFKILLMTNNLVRIIVNCKNEKQVGIVEQALPGAIPIINERDLANYDTLYLKYAVDIMQYKNIEKKKIYIINAMYNYDNGMFKECILLLVDHNIVSTIDPYKNLTIPALYDI